jgi:hypothetical protein
MSVSERKRAGVSDTASSDELRMIARLSIGKRQGKGARHSKQRSVSVSRTWFAWSKVTYSSAGMQLHPCRGYSWPFQGYQQQCPPVRFLEPWTELVVVDDKASLEDVAFSCLSRK